MAFFKRRKLLAWIGSIMIGLILTMGFQSIVSSLSAAPSTVPIESAYVIGQENFESWSQGFDEEGYLKVLPHPDVKVPFKDPYQDWKNNRPGNYVSSWGPQKELVATLTAGDLSQIGIDGFGIVKAGDGKISWLNNIDNPYESLKAYNGTIPGPLLIADPKDTLKIRLENRLDNPGQPMNLHTHGLHVSPLGPGDNVLVSIDPGENLDVSITLPADRPGLNWYHPHLHGLSTQQVAAGLVGQLWVAPPHDLPDLEKWNPRKANMYFLGINSFGIQQTLRQGKPQDPLNQNSSVSIPAGTPLAVLGTTGNAEKIYELSDAPNLGHNSKPQGYDPQNPTGNPEGTLPIYGGGIYSAEPLENFIHLVNGQYNPTIEVKTGQWNEFLLNNMTQDTFLVVQLVKQEGDKLIPQKVRQVAIDGNSFALATHKDVELTELPLMNPASRVSIKKWFERPGTYYLLSNGTEELLGENTSPLIKGRKGFHDGFSLWGPQVLATIEVKGNVVPSGAPPQQYNMLAKVDNDFAAKAQKGTSDRQRTFTWEGNYGYAVEAGHPTTLEGAWRINQEYFAFSSFADNMIPLTLPMLGTAELWTVNNASGRSEPTFPVDETFIEWHPFHIHQNDFLVLDVNGIPVQDFFRDTFPLVPTYAPNSPNSQNPFGTPQLDGNVSVTKILMKFDDYPGTFVNHCHILAHQDAGMMLAVRAILNTEDTWLGLGSQDNSDGKVQLIRANNPQQNVSLSPYGNQFKGAINVALGDVNYKKNNPTQNVTDNVTDVITVQRSLDNSNDQFTVRVFDGKTLIDEQERGKKEFDGQDKRLLIAEFTPFKDIQSSNANVSLATGDFNGDGYSDIILGISGDQQSPLIEIYSGSDFSLRSRIAPFDKETGFNGSINVAGGDVNGDNYDDVIVAQGKGGKGLVEAYSGQLINSKGSLDGVNTADNTEILSEPFQPYGQSYNGEVKVTSGYVLQRPDSPNGQPVQTFHANIITIAVDDLADGQQQIKVFTELMDEHHGTQTEGDSGNTQFNGSFNPSELRLDTAFTPEQKLTDLYGTFADLRGLPRGEPVLFGRDASGNPSFIYLQEKNIPTSIGIS